MSTILRQRRTSQGQGDLRPSVRHFLVTGQIALQPGDNPWTKIGLMDAKARLAREAWLGGDEPGARALLAQCPGLPTWFVS